MVTWGTQTQKLNNRVTTGFSNALQKISDAFNGTVNRVVSDVKMYFKNGGTTVVGINVNSIPSMKDSIRQYCDSVNTALSELNQYDPEIAFKGDEIVPALKVYIDAVKETCSAITSNMLAFNDQLTEVQTAYQTKDQNTASQINQTSEQLRSSYTKYTEQK